MTGEFIRRDLTKEEAARRQIDRAIQMYLEDDDHICTHVLVSAASTLLREYCEKIGLVSCYNSMIERVKPNFRKQFVKIKNRPFNFFKHANDDHDKKLEFFNEEVNAFNLYIASLDYQIAFQQKTSAMILFRVWFLLRWPNMHKDSHLVAETAQAFFGDLEGRSYENMKVAGAKKLKAIVNFEEALRDSPYRSQYGKVIESSRHLHNLSPARRRTFKVPSYSRILSEA
jgi:hypothetical protein